MRKKILIADDEADIVSMLRAFFESKGYFVLSAVNGTEALKQVEQEPDIILLDINMPGLDGLKVCERIRDYVSCPILFLTARIEDTDKVKGFAVGGDDYIVKPFSLMELEARVTAHLRREARRTFDARIKFSGDLTVDYSERCLFFEGQRLGLAKKNLILWNCYLKIRDRFLRKNGFMSAFGVMTAWGTAVLWRSISEGYGQRLQHIRTGHILKQFGGADTNGENKAL